MRIAIWEIHRLSRHPVSGDRQLPWDTLLRDLSPSATAIVARVARSEVKNYLAEMAEQAGVPFPGPAQFVHQVQTFASLDQARDG